MRSYSLMLLYIVQFSAHRQSHSTQSIQITMRRDSWGRHAPLSLGQLNENWLWKVNNNQLNQTTQLSARPPVHRAYFQTRRTILCVRSGRSKREKISDLTARKERKNVMPVSSVSIKMNFELMLIFSRTVLWALWFRIHQRYAGSRHCVVSVKYDKIISLVERSLERHEQTMERQDLFRMNILR